MLYRASEPSSPDGGRGIGAGATAISPANGLGGAFGDTQLPLLGAFTTNTDPFGMADPGATAWDADNPTSLAPALRRIFYIGDGRSGKNNVLGSFLTFTAPETATRLYLGLADGFSFTGPPGAYNDNSGSFAVTVTLMTPIPEPETYALMLAGLGLLGFAARRRKSGRPATL